MSDDGRGVGVQHFTVPNLDRDALITIEARAVNSHYAAWKKPAHRQRIEPSLPEPFLLPIHGYTILRGDAGKRRNCFNQVCAGV